MEFNEKSFARQKFRSSRGRGRGGRGGGSHRGGQYSGPARQSHKDLDSNVYRYEDDADKEEDGVVAPKTQGADLEALIDDAEVQFNQAFYRFRAQLHDVTEEVPPLGASHPEQLLAIDLEALAASLSTLPLHALLGLEPHYLAGAEPVAAASGSTSRFGSTVMEQRRPGSAETTSMAAAAVAPGGAVGMHLHSSPQPHPGGSLPAPSVSGASAAVQVSAMMPTRGPSPGALPTAAAAAVVRVSAGTATTDAASAGAHGGGGGVVSVSTGVSAGNERDEDEGLEALLMGRVRTRLAHPTAVPPTPETHTSALSGVRPAAGAALPPALAAAMAAAARSPPAQQVPAGPGLTRSEPRITAQAQARSVPLPHGGNDERVSSSAAASALPRLGSGSSPAAAVASWGLGAASRPVVPALPAARAPLPPHSLLPGMSSVVTSQGLQASGWTPGLARPAPGESDGHLPLAPTSSPPVAVVTHAAAAAAAAAPAAGVCASASGSAAEARAVVDDELRLLLGLPVGTGSGPKTQVQRPQPRLQAPVATANLQPAPRPAQQQQQQQQQQAQQASAKSLDDWLNSL